MLRAYEPVLRYTRGELFFPTAVAPYVEAASLWRGEEQGAAEQVVAPATSTSSGSARRRFATVAVRSSSDSSAAPEPPRVPPLANFPRERLDAGARFTTTGMFGRLVDAGLRASLFLRGSVAGGVAAGAENLRERSTPTGASTTAGSSARAVTSCLQYWFFYAMNDWRTTFGGINDHEADWETVTVYLGDEPARVRGPRGSRCPRTMARATTCAAAGTIPTCSSWATTRWSSSAPARTPGAFVAGRVRRHGRSGAAAAAARPPRRVKALAPWRDGPRTAASASPSSTTPWATARRSGPAASAAWRPVDDRRQDALGARLPRAVGARHRGLVRRRAGAGRARATSATGDPHPPGRTRSAGRGC